MRTFIYFHGFNSQGDLNSSKLTVLSKLGNVKTIDYNSFSSYPDIVNDLGERFKKLIHEDLKHEYVVIGTSLGAYWASKFSDEYKFPAILINPAINPADTLQKHIGLALKNFKTGKINELNDSVPPSYPKLSRRGMYLVLVDKGDDIIDPYETKKHFTANEVIMFEGGTHRFDHMEESLPYIQSFLNRIETTHY